MINSIQLKNSSVRYSTRMMLLISACLLLAQHYLPSVIHGGMDSNEQIARASGNLARQIAYLIIGGIGILGVRHARHLKQGKLANDYRMIVPTGLLIGWCMLSLFWSDMQMIAAKRIFVVCLMFLGSFGLSVVWDSVDVVRFIVISSTIDISIGVICDVVTGYFHPESAYYRFAGTLTPNEQGYLCMVLAIGSMCLAKMMALRGKPHRLYYFLSGYAVIFLVLTRSRGALLALAIGALFYFLLVVHTQKKVLTFFLIGSFILILAVSGAGTKVLDSLDRGGEGNDNFTGRSPLWTELMEYVDERPWTGQGYESFWNARTMDDVYRHQHWPVDSAHSEYVESLLTIGIVGMVLHTLALLIGMIEGIRLFRASQNFIFFLAAAMCCIYLVGGFLEAILLVKPSPISFYMALLLCSVMVGIPPDQQASNLENALLVAPNHGLTKRFSKTMRHPA